MEPIRCHSIAADRFGVARLGPPASSRSARQKTLIVETLDGKVCFFPERLTGGANEINSAARNLWRSWSMPKPLMPEYRKKRKHVRSAVWTANLFHWFLSFGLSYRCPECGAKCPRADDITARRVLPNGTPIWRKTLVALASAAVDAWPPVDRRDLSET
jgi:hypothetical protein